jgi:NAD(P)-dependent dehydrogenase (short-subunit alcohol dehydrogenase family)
MFENVAAALPARRIGQADDIAEAIILLMTNPFTTGTTLYVDGGGSIA